MKVTLITLLAICASIFTGCTTPVAIDPLTGQEQVAEYRAGFFYAPIDAPIGQIFKAAIREIDDLGYFRTGELHKDMLFQSTAAKSVTIKLRSLLVSRLTLKSQKNPNPHPRRQSR